MFFLSKFIIHNQAAARNVHQSIHLNFRRISNLKQQSNQKKNRFAQQILNKILLLRYSYFAAIGGSSKDGPPPNLSNKQVSQILRTNQFSVDPDYEPIKKIECNQLASNSPIEDRLRISKLQFNSFSQQTNKKDKLKDAFLFAVFDGHGGETCADLIADRLFSYLAVAMFNLKSNEKLIEPISIDYLKSLSLEKFKQIKKKVLSDQFIIPKLFNADSSSYRSQHLELLEDLVIEEELNNLIKFAEKLEAEPIKSVEDAISRSFNQCDLDLSDEIKRNITEPKSNIAVHYYLSLAASGSCVNLILIDNQVGYVASSGDCKAILGITNSESVEKKLVHLSIEHDSDNINEIRRIMDKHPKEEHNTILKNNRLLGRLMPLRAFGDFSYKWTIEEMQSYLTRAFGPHIIPPHYYTPPYLIVEPEITKFSLVKDDSNEESFIVLATDGLWEQFSHVKQIMKTVVKHKSKLNRNEEESDIFDLNSATYLLRNALGQTHLKNYDAHVLTEEIVRQQHDRLVSFLTLPQSVVRNFRDDISVIVIYL